MIQLISHCEPEDKQHIKQNIKLSLFIPHYY